MVSAFIPPSCLFCMIRVFVLCFALLGLSILLSSAVLTFLGSEDSALAPAGGSDQSITGEFINGPRDRPSTRPAAPQLDNAQVSSLNGLAATSLSNSVGLAIQMQVTDKLDAFIGSLVGDEERRRNVRAALVSAYSDAAELAANGTTLNDPDYVLNSLAPLLDADEQMQLETYLEDSSREAFMETYGPQIELVSPTLEPTNAQLLLETLFAETYGSTNPDGIPLSQTVDYLDSQLQAIQATRQRMRGSMEPSQFQLMDEFLTTQENGILKAQQIFASPLQ